MRIKAVQCCQAELAAPEFKAIICDCERRCWQKGEESFVALPPATTAERNSICLRIRRKR